MPTYQYACTECGEQLEKVQKFSDDPLTVCPNCNGRLRKVFSPVGIVFKGSGFYRTDSRSGPVAGGKDSNKDSGQEKVGSGSKAESSSGDKADKSDKSTDKSSAKSDSAGSSSGKDSGSSSSSSGKSSGSTSEKVA
ncbi:MAG TPA: FmdB family zinc ribbon protein [Streptosporangiaceae bacterium]